MEVAETKVQDNTAATEAAASERRSLKHSSIGTPSGSGTASQGGGDNQQEEQQEESKRLSSSANGHVEELSLDVKDVKNEDEIHKPSAELIRAQSFVLLPQPVRWWPRILLFGLVFCFGILFLLLFSDLPLGQGSRVYDELSAYYEWWISVLILSSVFFVVLLVLDVRNWKGRWRYVSYFLGGIGVFAFCLVVLLATKEFVVAPVGLFLLGTPFVLMLIKQTVFANMDLIDFLNTMRLSLAFLFAFSLVSWLSWIVIDENWWDLPTKFELYNKMKCNETSVALINNLTADELENLAITDPDLYEAADDVLVGCTSAFVLWIIPFVLALWSFVFAAMLHFLVNTIRRARQAGGATNAMDPVAQAMLMFISLGLFGLWAAAGIAGAEMSLTNVVLAMSFLAMILTGVVVVAVFGTSVIQEGMRETPLGNRMISMMDSDWVKAINTIMVLPLFLIYLAFSTITQASRKMLSCTKDVKEEDKHLIVSSRASRYLDIIRSWNWSAVLVKVHYLCIFFFVVSVGVVRVTSLFLSWLNEELAAVNLGITVVVFLTVGVVMFLNPAIPGVPVYVSGGIILVSSAQDAMGFWPAVLFTVGVCFFLKMSAIVIQQKIIGETFASKRVWIRRLVGVNSTEIRAIRDILLQPGITIAKVAVLCGGPDWPVSVLTGVLRLPLFSMLYGSLPVVFLIAPCVAAGALLLRSDEGGIWGSLSTITLAFATITQSLAMLAAIHFIAKTVIEKEAELKAIPPDEEVLALDQKSEALTKLRNYVSHWSNIHMGWRVLLSVSAMIATFSCYVFFLLGSQCFESFQVSDSISEVLDGDARNIIKPLGLFTSAAFFFSCFLLFVFNVVMSYKAKHSSNVVSSSVVGTGVAVDESPDESERQSVRRSVARGIAKSYFSPFKK